MGQWTGRIRAKGLPLDAEIWFQMPEETRQGLRWHGAISCQWGPRGAGCRRLRRDLASPETTHTLDTDVGTIQIETVSGDRITFRGCGAPIGSLAEAIQGSDKNGA
jgi:hypothetical protein